MARRFLVFSAGSLAKTTCPTHDRSFLSPIMLSTPCPIPTFEPEDPFGLSENLIARMEGVKNPSAVRGMIIRISDQLRGSNPRAGSR
jgi:hypothetical protein